MSDRYFQEGSQNKMKTIKLCNALIFAILASLFLVGDSQAIFISRKLSGVLPVDWKVDDYFVLTPDNQFVVYTQYIYVAPDATHELYSAPLAGGEPIHLNDALVSGGSVEDFKVSSDSKYVVYLADQDEDERFELYGVPIDGGVPIRLNDDLVAGGNVKEFTLTPNGQGVVYLADQEIDETRELYSNWITGGTPYKLNGEVHPGGDVMEFQITANSLGVVYQADQEVGYGNELHSVLIDGTEGRKIADWVWDFAITPDDQRVLYVAGRDLDVRELFQVSILGGTALNLSGPYAGSTFRVDDFEIADTSGYVVFQADKEVDGLYELFSVPVLGGVPVKINPSLSAGREISEFSLGGTRVAYLSDQATAGMFELYCAPIAGGPGVKLNDELTPEGDVQYFAFTPNNLGVGFLVDATVDEEVELYSASISGADKHHLNTPLPDGGKVLDFAISPNNLVVIYRADATEQYTYELYGVSIFGGASQKLSSQLVEEGDVEPNYQITNDNQRLIYEADQEVLRRYELYLAQEGFGVYLPGVARP